MVGQFNLATLFLTGLPCFPAPPGKSTIASDHPMEGLAFVLKYFPATASEDSGAGNVVNHGGEEIQGRSQVLQNGHYTSRNCQLFSSSDSVSDSSAFQSLTANGLGQECSYTSGQTTGTELHKVFAFNENQCCKACVATAGCTAATFQTSGNDHAGGHGPQSWEGFGIHMPKLPASSTTGGIPVAALEAQFKNRLGDLSSFDAFMDYSVTFFTPDLQTYVDAFTQDDVPYHVAEWNAGSESWYSLFVLVDQNHYVVELTSNSKPNVAVKSQLEQRMSDAHVKKFKSYQAQEVPLLWISSINRATSDMDAIDNAYSSLMKASTTLSISDSSVTRKCYSWASSVDASAGPAALDEDVCFTNRASTVSYDSTFSVADFEQMLWSEHAAVMGSNPSATNDMYTDSHFALPISSSGLSALSSEFNSNNPFPITDSTRLAYSCKQNYIIDPTGWSIQPIGRPSWPNCGGDVSV